MSISIKFRLTQQEAAESFRIAARHVRRSQRKMGGLARAALWLVVMVVPVTTVVTRVALGSRKPPIAASPAGGGLHAEHAWILLACIFPAVVCLLILDRVRQKRASTVEIGDTYNVFADNDRFFFTTSTSTTEIQWFAFRAFEETSRLFILYRGDPKSAQLGVDTIPKRAFASAASLAEFRGLLDAHIGTGEACFPIIPLAAKNG